MNNKITERISYFAVAASLAATPQSVHAQNTQENEEGGASSNVIIVTAQRREEKLIDVPLSVTALSQDALETAGVNNVGDIGTAVPNIQINETVGNRWSPLITIRGLAPSSDTSLGRDQPVGIYVDGVPVAKSTGAAFDTVDLQRIEVLRGPQGTLYGRNSIGGAVNLVTKEPSGEFGGQLLLSAGEKGYFQEKLIVDLPVIDTGLGELKAKIGVNGRQFDGFYDQLGPSRDFGEVDMAAGRFDLLWDVTPEFSIRYAYDITDHRGTGVALPISAPGLIGPTSPVPSLRALFPLIQNAIFTSRPKGIANDFTGRSSFKVQGHAINVEYQASDALTFKSITAWRSLETRSRSDFDGIAVDLIHFTLNNSYDQFSQELQVFGDYGDVHFTLGGFYFNDSYDVFNPRWAFRFGNESRFDLSDRSGDNDSIAAYGQLVWSPSALDNNLDISLGVRWTKDTKRARNLFFSYNRYAANPADPLSGVFVRDANGNPVTVSGGPALGALPDSGGAGLADLTGLNARKSFKKFTPEVSLIYRIKPEWTVYARYASGFKSGGFNDVAAANAAFLTPYEPENIDSFEIGTKGVFADGRLGLNATYYKSIYTDFQAGVFVPSLITTNVINADKALFDGIELEGFVRPVDALTLRFGYGYTDARYDRFILPDGTDVTNTYNVPLVPKHNYQLGANWNLALSETIDLITDVNWSWRGRQSSNLAPDPLTDRIAYGLLDGKITLAGVQLGKGVEAEFSVWGKNLTDKEYWTSALNLQIFTVRQWGNPRQFGFDARVRF